MTLPELSIRRHVLAYMVSAVMVLFGILGFQRIGIDQFPEIEFPLVSVTTVLPGASPEIVEASITSIIESSVNSVPGIDYIQSSSSPGVSNVTINFQLSKDIDVAFNEVQAKVNQIVRQLPEDADPPVVAKVEVGASPVMWLALQGDRTMQQLNQYAENVISKRLETINGVGEVRIGGRRERTIRVEVDLERMNALDITPQDIRRAFASEHVQFPGGFLVSGRTESLIKLDLEYHSPEALSRMVVAHRDGAAIRLDDIAEVVDGLADYRSIARFNEEPTVGLGIVKISGSNTVAIVDEVQRRLEEEIIPQLPPGMTIQVASDDSELIREIVRALQDHLWEGALLAAIIVLLFLRSWRGTIIIALAIPVSLLAAMAAINLMGYTLNTMTLLALLLLIGVVVDDAIVVLENIYRHRQEEEPDPEKAAISGSNQVFFAIIATTLTLVSIFASVIFLGGIIGRFFESFAVTVTVGVLASSIVALTLTPVLCARFLRVRRTDSEHGRIYHSMDRFFDGMNRGYRRLLDASLNRRWTVILVALLVVASSGFFFVAIDKEFVPEEDEGRFQVFFRAPLGTGIEATNEYMKEIESVLGSKDVIRSYFTAIGLGAAGEVNRGIAFARMVERSERDIKQQDFLDELRSELAGIPGVIAFAAPPSIVSGQRGDPLQFSITGPDLDTAAELGETMKSRLEEIDGMGRLDLDLQLNLPQIDIDVDRVRAAEAGVSSADLAFAVNMLVGGFDIARYNDEPGDGERYDIRVKAREGQFDTPDDLNRIYLRGSDGSLVRFDSIAEGVERLGPAVITRFDLNYSADFFGNPEMPLGEAITAIDEIAEEILPLGYRVAYKAQAREFQQTQQYVMFAFVLATILVFIVLASQFNSFIQPLIVMVAQPLAVIGGVLLLWLTGNSLNIYSMIGMVLLVGLVAKNSILLVDLTNQFRNQGQGVDEALGNACPIRLRPVLMTSLTVILALTPPALGFGAGADTNGPLAIAVIGGMLSSTLLTLVVVPAVYSLIENSKFLGSSSPGQKETEST
ncbi:MULTISPECIES: efflux RND transporter permease subunit [unclassified Wenzhouxiangella]|uniref:efflux RND transporter permease subunit n=1 Tax=unclassified Wenzhouxiangella TaxID=2613841 RepID=UPI000E327F68|nr:MULTISPECIES: efflux RND transporter permease subunit [unclassified Wenzhouxiangella]RFF26284.1 efflux RND transporter permease subunit [Wenzhouxiangella sp. 15181]RFP67445.1 efflux RND transporter permease subunit [Wenzhouxiangella sp. 15190]